MTRATLFFLAILMAATPAFARDDHQYGDRHDRPSSWVQFRDAATRQLGREVVRELFRPPGYYPYAVPAQSMNMVPPPRYYQPSAAVYTVEYVHGLKGQWTTPTIIRQSDGRLVATCWPGARNSPPGPDGLCHD